jgi:membrane protease YdiL (CAAX protease family)
MASEAEGQANPVGLVRRIVAFPVSLMCIGFVMVVGAAIVTGNLIRLLALQKNTPLWSLRALVIALVVIFVYKLFKRWVEREPDRELPLTGLATELPAGLIAGFLLFSVMAGIVSMLGGLMIKGMNSGSGQLWSMLGLAITSGVAEETVFRGLILRQIEAWLGTWWALAITSAIFGFGHIFNPGATLFAGFAIMMEAGILLGACYLYTRRLWLPIGLHAAWNFTQGWVFSAPVSGSKASEGLLVTARAGPDWLTGGAFGLEASVVAMVVATLAGVIMLWLTIRRGRIIPPAWRRTDI